LDIETDLFDTRSDGVFLPEEMYKEMEAKIQKQTDDLARMDEVVEGKNREISLANEALSFAHKENESLRSESHTMNLLLFVSIKLTLFSS